MRKRKPGENSSPRKPQIRPLNKKVSTSKSIECNLFLPPILRTHCCCCRLLSLPSDSLSSSIPLLLWPCTCPTCELSCPQIFVMDQLLFFQSVSLPPSTRPFVPSPSSTVTEWKDPESGEPSDQRMHRRKWTWSNLDIQFPSLEECQ